MKLLSSVLLLFCLVQVSITHDPEHYTTELFEQHGYAYEEHMIVSPAGYKMRTWRVLGKVGSEVKAGRKVVLVQHGCLSSSSDWVIPGPEKSLPYILTEAGYDVWLGNSRGNMYARDHTYLDPEKKTFWDYSWNEIGQDDLPSVIDYILQKTEQQKLHYIGHSQGTTIFFVMGALRQDMMSKIMSAHMLAPVAFMRYTKSPFLRAIAPFIYQFDWLNAMLGNHEFFPNDQMMEEGGAKECRDESPFQEMCANSLFLVGGYNSAQLNYTHLPIINMYTPAGASRHQIVHFAQGVNHGQFRMFDYGMFGNLAKYGVMIPPSYDLKKVTAPVALHYGDNDWLAAVRDVDRLADKLPNLIGKFRVLDGKCNHFDFLWGIDSKVLIYDTVMKIMKDYEE